MKDRMTAFIQILTGSNTFLLIIDSLELHNDLSWLSCEVTHISMAIEVGNHPGIVHVSNKNKRIHSIALLNSDLVILFTQGVNCFGRSKV